MVSAQFIVNSQEGIKAAAFLTEMIRLVFGFCNISSCDAKLVYNECMVTILIRSVISAIGDIATGDLLLVGQQPVACLIATGESDTACAA